MKRKTSRLSLSKETLRTLDSSSLDNVAGGTTPGLIILVSLECVALAYTVYKIVKSN